MLATATIHPKSILQQDEPPRVISVRSTHLGLTALPYLPETSQLSTVYNVPSRTLH